MHQPPLEEIWVVTVNWNKPEDTCECLESLAAQVGVAIQILVVDNGSTDRSIDIIQGRFPAVRIARSEKNLGFAGGFNLGIRLALEQDARQILIINNDTIADPWMCRHLMDRMNESRVGITAPVIYYASQPEEIWSSGGMFNNFLLEPKDAHGRRENLGSKPITRTFLSGCCMLINRSLLEAVGLFDERFFLYYEDMDFCYRIYKSGWTMEVVPAAKLWHKVSKSSGGERSPVERYHMARSSAIYFRKHITWKNGAVIFFYRLGSAILWSFRLGTKKKWSALSAFWKGWFEGWFRG